MMPLMESRPLWKVGPWRTALDAVAVHRASHQHPAFSGDVTVTFANGRYPVEGEALVIHQQHSDSLHKLTLG